MAVAYWRFPIDGNTFHTSIIAAKSRVASMKGSTIPRMELQAAQLGTRLAKTIGAEHDFTVSRRVLWSDSTTVLYWLRRDPKDFKVFVENRLKEIRENSLLSEWRYVPTRENPADDATRFAAGSLSEKSRWLVGPDFLRRDESEWPDQSNLKLCVRIDDEIKRVSFYLGTLPGPLIDFSRFSVWFRLIYSVVRVLKCVDRMRERKSSLTDLRCNAERVCVRISQRSSFNDVMDALRDGREIPRNSKLVSLDPVIDESGILRINGRLTNFTNESGELIYQPIVLDSKDAYTVLLVKHYHERYFHGSHETVLNELRQEYWILGLRQLLRSLVYNCSVCRMMRAKPADPRMGALPPGRLAYRERPFSHCGVDYFEPKFVKIGRR